VYPKIRLANPDDLALYFYAYRVQTGKDPGEKYRKFVTKELSCYDHIRVVEDINMAFGGGFAPVGLAKAMYNEWKLEPHADWFPWATPRNKLRCSVAYLYKQRCSKDVGVTIVHAQKEAAHYFRHLKKYVPLYPVGKIPAGHPEGDDFVFYQRGKKRLEVISNDQRI